MCYKKNPDGSVTVLENSIINSSGYFTPRACDSLTCVPDNCMKWKFDHGVQIIEPVDVVDLPENRCKIDIIQNAYEESLKISLNCNENGNIQVEIYDLLGNIILQREYSKNTRYFTKEIGFNLGTGIYFCKVNLNKQVYYNQKLIIIK
ncbi:MAG: Peptidase protein [Ignavibacteria bacterium]|nr:Peptidase protein [Ignavibacteria bacterium]